MFRSKYAKPEVRTFVELTFTYRGKDYTVKRNPEYLRPKDRGQGMTTEKANAELIFPDERQTVTKKYGSDQGGNAASWIGSASVPADCHDCAGRFSETSPRGNGRQERNFPKNVPYGNLSGTAEPAAGCGESAVENVMMRKNGDISQYLEGIVCPEDAVFQKELAKLKKEKFDGEVMRGMELLALCIEMDQERLSRLEEERSALGTQMEQQNRLLGKVKESRKRQEEKPRKKKNWRS